MSRLHDEFERLHKRLDQIDEALRGSTRTRGVMTRLYVLEQWVRNTSRLVRLVVAAALTSVFAAIVSILRGGGPPGGGH